MWFCSPVYFGCDLLSDPECHALCMLLVTYDDLCDRILAPCNYCHHPWCFGHKSHHKALLIMFGCDGISDHASWNEVFHYRDTKLSCARARSLYVIVLTRTSHHRWLGACALVHHRWPIINTSQDRLLGHKALMDKISIIGKGVWNYFTPLIDNWSLAKFKRYAIPNHNHVLYSVIYSYQHGLINNILVGKQDSALATINVFQCL